MSSLLTCSRESSPVDEGISHGSATNVLPILFAIYYIHIVDFRTRKSLPFAHRKPW